MKNMIKISLVLMLLIVSSAIYPVIALDTSTNQVSASFLDQIEVMKEVWDPDLEEWVDYYEAEKDESVTFKITITYRQTCPDGVNLSDIQVIDTLPENITYVSSSTYNESWINGSKIIWI